MAVSRTGENNSFGWAEGYNKFTVTNVGWSGLGFNISGEDISMIDDTYWLHFGMRATDRVMHTSHTMTVGNARFMVGNSDGKLATIGDFKRDGEWYFFDIPVKALRQFAASLFGNGTADNTGHIITFSSGGMTDA